MGAVLAKFRTPDTTYDILENLEHEIHEIEEYSLHTQQKQKRYVGNFLLISIGLYITVFLIFYLAFLPPSWLKRITYSIPLLIFPLLIFLTKKLVAWYFQRKLNKNSKQLKQLRNEKKKVLERVMETETYKVALEILNKFGDKTNGFKTVGVVTPLSKVIQPVISFPPQQQQLTQHSNKNLSSYMSPASLKNVIQNQQLNNSRVTPAGSFHTKDEQSSFVMKNSNLYSVNKVRTPFPVINRKEQSVLEKIIDYLTSDGPQNRYAMICKKCYGHNGMATRDEFEFAEFRCVYCNYFHPPRKTKPSAPTIEETLMEELNVKNSNTQQQIAISRIDSVSASASSSDSEEEQASGEYEDNVNYGIFTKGIQQKTDIDNDVKTIHTTVDNEKPIEEKKND